MAAVRLVGLGTDYTLTLFGGGYWRQQTFQVEKNQQAQLILSKGEIDRPCIENLADGLQAIVCMQDGSAPAQSWHNKLNANAATQPKQRQLSVGVELADSVDIQTTPIYDQLLQTSALDVIYRLYPTANNSERNVQALRERLPISHVQALIWGGDKNTQSTFNASLGEKLPISRSLNTSLPSISPLQQLLQPAEKSYITEAEMLTALSLNSDAVVGDGDPMIFFRPLMAMGSLMVETSQPALVEFSQVGGKKIKASSDTTMRLRPGNWEITAQAEGHYPARMSVTIRAGEFQTVKMKLAPKPIPETALSQKYSLTIKSTPSDARIRVMNIRPKYQPDMALKSGTYDIEVSAPGFEVSRKLVNLVKDSEFVVALKPKPKPKPKPKQYTLTIQTTPADAQITFKSDNRQYQPGMTLEGGRYDIEVTRVGFNTWIDSIMLDKDATFEVALKKGSTRRTESNAYLESLKGDADLKREKLDR